MARRCICTHCLNTHFEKLKNSEQKSWGYIGTFYVHAQSFGEKPCIFVARVKKIKKCKMNSCNEASEIVFFTQATKNVVFHRNLVNAYKMSGYTREIFVSNFSNFLKCVFRQWMHLCLGAKTPGPNRLHYIAVILKNVMVRILCNAFAPTRGGLVCTTRFLSSLHHRKQ